VSFDEAIASKNLEHVYLAVKCKQVKNT